MRALVYNNQDFAPHDVYSSNTYKVMTSAGFKITIEDLFLDQALVNLGVISHT